MCVQLNCFKTKVIKCNTNQFKTNIDIEGIEMGVSVQYSDTSANEDNSFRNHIL